MMHHRPFNVLFICADNSARSIMAEALLNRIGQGRFVGLSAGSFPKGEVDPRALSLLGRTGIGTDGLHSKSWDEFAKPGAAPIDFVITVCDKAAGEACPVWPGLPITAHWGVPDPAAIDGPEEAQQEAFRSAFLALEQRISLFTNLPLETLDQKALRVRLHEIGQEKDALSRGS
jgi:arsenate reductase (thioredoxin)